MDSSIPPTSRPRATARASRPGARCLSTESVPGPDRSEALAPSIPHPQSAAAVRIRVRERVWRSFNITRKPPMVMNSTPSPPATTAATGVHTGRLGVRCSHAEIPSTAHARTRKALPKLSRIIAASESSGRFVALLCPLLDCVRFAIAPPVCERIVAWATQRSPLRGGAARGPPLGVSGAASGSRRR